MQLYLQMGVISRRGYWRKHERVWKTQEVVERLNMEVAAFPFLVCLPASGFRTCSKGIIWSCFFFLFLFFFPFLCSNWMFSKARFYTNPIPFRRPPLIISFVCNLFTIYEKYNFFSCHTGGTGLWPNCANLSSYNEFFIVSKHDARGTLQLNNI